MFAAGCSDQTNSVADTIASAAPGDDTSQSAPTAPAPDGADAPSGQRPEGFSSVMARVTAVDGEVCEVCVWLAATAEERARGLMGVTDLGGAAGMVFRFDEPIAGWFYMFQTPTPLSIAWFGPVGGVVGEFVGEADMAPCLDTLDAECMRYSPASEYDLALEVFEGGLGALGVGPGSRLELLDGTEGCAQEPSTAP